MERVVVGAVRERAPMPEVLKVGADSKPKAVAGAVAAVLREKGSVELQAVGAGAVNQAVKAIAITRGFVAPNGIDIITIPAFTKVMIDGEERTAIKFLVQPRRLFPPSVSHKVLFPQLHGWIPAATAAPAAMGVW